MRALSLLVILSMGGWASPAFHALSLDSRRIIAAGPGIQSVRLEVFDLSGRRIFNSGPVLGATYKWHLQRDDGKIVANGVYLYIVTSRTDDGRETRSAVGKLAVRR